MALLLDAGRLGVALYAQQAPKVGAVRAGDVLPRWFALVVTERELAIRLGL